MGSTNPEITLRNKKEGCFIFLDEGNYMVGGKSDCSAVVWASFPMGFTERPAGEVVEICGTPCFLIALNHMHDQDI